MKGMNGNLQNCRNLCFLSHPVDNCPHYLQKSLSLSWSPLLIAAEAFELRSVSLDEDPHRSVLVERQSNTAIPTPTLADALAASRKQSSATLNLGSLRKAIPERKPNNALYFEGVLGYDEESLGAMLKPHMKGLKFTLNWVVSQSLTIVPVHCH